MYSLEYLRSIGFEFEVFFNSGSSIPQLEISILPNSFVDSRTELNRFKEWFRSFDNRISILKELFVSFDSFEYQVRQSLKHILSCSPRSQAGEGLPAQASEGLLSSPVEGLPAQTLHSQAVRLSIGGGRRLPTMLRGRRPSAFRAKPLNAKDERTKRLFLGRGPPSGTVGKWVRIGA